MSDTLQSLLSRNIPAESEFFVESRNSLLCLTPGRICCI